MGAKDETLGTVYANALLDLVFEKGVHSEVLSELREVGRLLAEEPRFAPFLNTPQVGQQAKKDVIQRVFGGRVSDPTLNFLKIVIDKRRQANLPDMIEAFRAGYHVRMGELVVKVASSVPLAGGQQEELAAILKRKFDKEIILEERVDPELIGGLVLRVGDSRIDGSLRTRLEAIGDRLETARLRSEDYYEN